MTVVISDTSAMRCLAHLGLVHLLKDHFGSVLVPTAVEQELLLPSARFPAMVLTQFPFIQVQAPRDRSHVQQLRSQLDPGEAEAIVLALESGPAPLVIDEKRGRRVAQRLGLAITGTLGILLEAKRTGRVGPIRPLIERLENELNFFVSSKLRSTVLKLAGE